jgi:hypothetical protein
VRGRRWHPEGPHVAETAIEAALPCIDFVAMITAYNWDPSVALMPVTPRRVTWRLVPGVLG